MNGLRWIIRKNKVSSNDILVERMLSDETLLECKNRMTDEDKPVLQYQDHMYDWHDVKTVIEYRNEN